MKTGRNLQEVLVELNRQNKAKQDFISPAQGMRLREDGRTFEINHLTSNQQEVFGTTPLFHRQVASALGIPAKYYDLMQAQKPTLLAENVNAWFGDKTNSYMVRSMDYGGGRVARALLSERYRRIDNLEVASAVLPLFAGSDQYEVVSSEVTEHRLYLKVVSRRLEMEVRKGDIVQAEAPGADFDVFGILDCVQYTLAVKRCQDDNVTRSFLSSESWVDDYREPLKSL